MLRDLLAVLSPELAKRGLPTNRGGSFRRARPDGWQTVVVEAETVDSVTRVFVHLLIRFDAIERFMGTTGPLARESPSSSTLSLSLASLRSDDALWWELSAAGEVESVAREILELYDEVGPALFTRYSSVQAVADLLAEETDEAVALAGTAPNRLAIAVVSAFLVGGGRLAFRRSLQKRAVATTLGPEYVARFDEFCEHFFAGLLPAPPGAEPAVLPPEGKWSDLTRKRKKADAIPGFLDGAVEFFIDGAWQQMFPLPGEIAASNHASAAVLRAVSAAGGAARPAPSDLSRDVRRRLPKGSEDSLAWATHREIERTRWGTTPASVPGQSAPLYAGGREHTTGWVYVETRAAAEA